jgi:hypothetical protein
MCDGDILSDHPHVSESKLPYGFRDLVPRDLDGKLPGKYYFLFIAVEYNPIKSQIDRFTFFFSLETAQQTLGSGTLLLRISGSTGFKSRSEVQPSWLRFFMLFLSSLS